MGTATEPERRAPSLPALIVKWSVFHVGATIGAAVWFVLGGLPAHALVVAYAPELTIYSFGAVSGGAFAFGTIAANQFWREPEQVERKLTTPEWSLVEAFVMITTILIYVNALLGMSLLVGVLGSSITSYAFLLAAVYPLVDTEVVERFDLSPAILPPVAFAMAVSGVGIARNVADDVIGFVHAGRRAVR